IDLCNRYGVSTHEFGPLIDFVVALYERGIITRDDTGGLVLERGFETASTLIRQVAFREGIGDILADGEVAIIKKFGSECERYSTQKKTTPVRRDGRSFGLTPGVVEEMINPLGGEDVPAVAGAMPTHFSTARGVSQEQMREQCRRTGVSEEAQDRIFDAPTGYNASRLTRHAEDWYSIMNALGCCMRAHIDRFYSIDTCAGLYSAATGIEIEPAELKEAGERIWNLQRVLNVREGFSRKDDTFPVIWLEPLKNTDGKDLFLEDSRGKVLTAEDLSTRVLDDYYAERGWDIEKGIPTKEKLTSLGLGNQACDLEKSGYY
ncbi:aldehyde ferredoxin oxidoreductase C-terminal domain-containing protein, partial [Chloroflexota bacterium]